MCVATLLLPPALSVRPLLSSYRTATACPADRAGLPKVMLPFERLYDGHVLSHVLSLSDVCLVRYQICKKLKAFAHQAGGPGQTHALSSREGRT